MPLLFLLIGFFLFAHHAAAQQAEVRVTVRLDRISLHEALQRIASEAQLSLVYDPELVANRQSRCTRRDLRAEDALRCVLSGTGLEAYQLSSGGFSIRRIVRPDRISTPSRYIVQGRVVESGTDLPIESASLSLVDLRQGASSRHNGTFTLPPLEEGAYVLRVTHVGYVPYTDTLRVGRNTDPLTLRLSPRKLIISPLIVESGPQVREEWVPEPVDNPELTIFAPQEVNVRISRLTGMRLSNTTAELHLQGGAAGEHLTLLDGAPLLPPPVLAGTIGPFSPLGVGRIRLQRAGFDAAVGSSTAGFVEVEHLLSSQDPFQMVIQVDPYSLNGRLLSNESDSLGNTRQSMVAIRTSIWQAYAPPATRNLLQEWNRSDAFMDAVFNAAQASSLPPGSDPMGPFLNGNVTQYESNLQFLDVHLTNRLKSAAHSRWNSSGYLAYRSLGTNNASTRAKDTFTWLSGVVQSTHERFVGKASYVTVQGWVSAYDSDHTYTDFSQPRAINVESDEGNVFLQLGGRVRMVTQILPELDVQVGIMPTWSRYSLRVPSTQKNVDLLDEGHQAIFASFVQASWNEGPWTVRAGSRQTYQNEQKFYIEPRVSVQFRSSKWSTRLAAGLFRQFLNQYNVSNTSPRALVSTSRVWTIPNRDDRPPVAHHAVAELAWRPNAYWHVGIDSYLKRYPRLNLVDYSGQETNSFLIEGRGFSYGAGFIVQWNRSSQGLWARLDTERSERKSVLFSGAYYVVPWNEPLRLSLSYHRALFPNLILSGRWQSVWGRAWGFRQAYYDFIGAYGALRTSIPTNLEPALQRQISLFTLTQPADHQLRALHQLDLNMVFTPTLLNSRVQIRMEALNVLNRRNVAEWRLQGDPVSWQTTGLLKLEERLLLPLTVVLGARLTL